MQISKVSLAVLGGSVLGLSGCGGAPAPTADEQTGSTQEALTTSQSSQGGFQIPNGFCIQPATPPPGPLSPGVGVTVYDCIGHPGGWTFNLGLSSNNALNGQQGTIVVGGLCLDANYNTGAVTMNTCNRSESQEWTWSQGKLQPPAHLDKCLSTGFGVGSSATLTTCGSTELNYSFTPTSFPMVFVNSIAASLQFAGPHPLVVPPHVPAGIPNNLFQCLDVFLDLEQSSGDNLDNFQCNETNAQWFSFNRQRQLVTQANTCVTAASPSSGAAVQIQPCATSGSVPTSQQWGYAGTTLYSLMNPNGSLIAPYCLDVSGENNAPLTQVVVSNCAYSSTPAGQKWVGNLIWPQVQKLVFRSKYFDVQEENAWANLTVYSNGNWGYEGSVHDYGFFNDKYVMDVRATTAPPNQSGLAFTHQGSVEGTIQINPRRDDSWSDHGFDRAIATNWNALATGGVTFNIDVNTDIGSVALAVGTDLTVGTLVVGGVVVALLTGGCDGQTRVYGDTEVTCGGGPPADNVP